MTTAAIALGKMKKRSAPVDAGFSASACPRMAFYHLFAFPTESTKGQNQLHHGKEIIKEIMFKNQTPADWAGNNCVWVHEPTQKETYAYFAAATHI